MEPVQTKTYKYVSDIYPYLMRFIDYDSWAMYYHTLTNDYLDNNSTVLELAAGNCKLCCGLKSYFNDVIASDLSIEMLKKSEVNNITRVCCNMEALPFRKTFDLIISAFDSVNYLLTKKSFTNLLNEVRIALKDNGIFSFDVSLEKNSLKNLRYLNRKGTYKGIKYIQRSEYDRDKMLHTNKFKLTLEDGQEFIEIHKQRIFPLETYFDLIVSNGFMVRECFDAFSLNDATEESERVQFIVMKEKKNVII
ncbi:MAG: class I SAM-dependent methyltransferase [Methanococcaceae archaeon]